MVEGSLFIAMFSLFAVGAWWTRRWLPFRRHQKQRFEYNDAPFGIEKSTGKIYIKSSSLVLRRGLRKSTFLGSDLYRHTINAKLFALERGFVHKFLLTWRDPLFENVYLWLNFENETLGWVDFGWGPKVTIAEWTREKVEAEVARYRAFMIQQLGAIGGFRWGKAYATLNQKAAAPTMGIRYKGFAFRTPRKSCQ